MKSCSKPEKGDQRRKKGGTDNVLINTKQNTEHTRTHKQKHKQSHRTTHTYKHTNKHFSTAAGWESLTVPVDGYWVQLGMPLFVTYFPVRILTARVALQRGETVAY